MLHRVPRRGRGKGVVVVAFGVLVVVLFQVFFPRVIPNILYNIATPVVYGYRATADFITLGAFIFTSKECLLRENEALIVELAEANEKRAAFDALVAERASLQALYGREDTEKMLLAVVLLAPPLSPYDTFVLDVGAKEGVEAGSLVRSISGLPLGRITEVFRDFSRVELLSSPGTETAVRIGEENVQVRAVGIGDGEFQLLVPREFVIAKGDVVIFPDLSALPVGKVGSIDYQETDFLQLVSFRSPVNLRALLHVLVELSDARSTLEDDTDSI